MIPITILAVGLFVGQFLFLYNVFRSMRRGAEAGRNPWDSNGLEWETESPAPHGNFGDELPVVHRGPYDYSPDEAESDGRDFLPQTAGGNA